MVATAFVRARIDETLKNEATAVLADMGLTVSDVVRIALTKIVMDKALYSICARLTKLRQKRWQKASGARTFTRLKMLMTCLNNLASDASA